MQRSNLELPKELCRTAKVPPSSFACVFHRKKLDKQHVRCSCPLSTHSSDLSTVKIPERLHTFLENVLTNSFPQESYQPGTRWCTSCRNAFKKEAQQGGKSTPALYNPPPPPPPPNKRNCLKVNKTPAINSYKRFFLFRHLSALFITVSSHPSFWRHLIVASHVDFELPFCSEAVKLLWIKAFTCAPTTVCEAGQIIHGGANVTWSDRHSED